jgi:hypothetical protein
VSHEAELKIGRYKELFCLEVPDAGTMEEVEATLPNVEIGTRPFIVTPKAASNEVQHRIFMLRNSFGMHDGNPDRAEHRNVAYLRFVNTLAEKLGGMAVDPVIHTLLDANEEIKPDNHRTPKLQLVS